MDFFSPTVLLFIKAMGEILLLSTVGVFSIVIFIELLHRIFGDREDERERLRKIRKISKNSSSTLE